ncbi:hypothetical protein CLAFUW4_13619 [Fulvia fulva]|uniref:Uncharacterized protein n=1 Tax=Passalora fulva TaxID=5499 RepID=A0A9Q8UW53_PASFU|nr:uncharacterized protein CLAFUR5_13471 [Fulvia fulva]KAK4610646.1 hypothetical protein CLAFUR4_13622 [Fulvia fulva]KAK4611294.1 hypothetical protein CLAFUR0_13626 [Fulvia fulva]UJO24552.1 hypothetical protein CLAFUR5_13471 [Fulvia fulva]WPV21897.1 hypothetical protein CLAFUW4_13619 [Fulvia fulva]WPV37087.1 hypothetical protein CLAFUW7_13627 [Fulvia fulva]
MLIPPISSLLRLSDATSSGPSSVLDVRCNNSIIGTPSFGLEDAIFTVCAEIEIQASVPAVYTTFLDFRNYHTWNTFVQDVHPLPGNSIDRIPPPIGTKMVFENVFPPIPDELPGPSVERLSFTERNVDGEGRALVAWVGYESAEHPSVLTALGEGRMRFVSWETFYGIHGLALVVGREWLQERHEQQARDLKGYVEGFGR